MRVKISTKEYGLEGLSFGKIYGIAYVGCSLFEEFKFTRKNKIEMCEYGNNDKKISSRWISKRELKRIINGNYVDWIGKRREYYF